MVWNIWIIFSISIGNNKIPTDELIFFRGVGIPPTRYILTIFNRKDSGILSHTKKIHFILPLLILLYIYHINPVLYHINHIYIYIIPSFPWHHHKHCWFNHLPMVKSHEITTYLWSPIGSPPNARATPSPRASRETGDRATGVFKQLGYYQGKTVIYIYIHTDIDIYNYIIDIRLYIYNYIYIICIYIYINYIYMIDIYIFIHTLNGSLYIYIY